MKPLPLPIAFAALIASAAGWVLFALVIAMAPDATEQRETTTTEITTQINALRTEHAAEIDALRKALDAATLERQDGERDTRKQINTVFSTLATQNQINDRIAVGIAELSDTWVDEYKELSGLMSKSMQATKGGIEKIGTHLKSLDARVSNLAEGRNQHAARRTP